jgi:hypothetical protein
VILSDILLSIVVVKWTISTPIFQFCKTSVLTDSRSTYISDFYSYRYFASEGFLPGYNFPRLPLSAFIPARRRKEGKDEFLSRPRFLAISEFGPRAVVYHEGSQYQINRVILPISEEGIVVSYMKQCQHCGFIHPENENNCFDKCERCGEELTFAYRDLFKMENVSTRRRQRINSDEEERLRLGYEIKTGFRFAFKNGDPICTEAIAYGAEDVLVQPEMDKDLLRIRDKTCLRQGVFSGILRL